MATSPTSVLRRVPLPVWAFLLAGALAFLPRLFTGGRARVVVVGSGALVTLRAQDAPPGQRYDLRLASGEPAAETARRAEAAIAEWPDIIVIGLSSGPDADAEERASVLIRLMTRAENATAVPVVILPPGALQGSSASPLRERCDREGLRICVDIGDGEAEIVRAAVAAAVTEARSRHDALRASTQVGGSP